MSYEMRRNFIKKLLRRLVRAMRDFCDKGFSFLHLHFVRTLKRKQTSSQLPRYFVFGKNAEIGDTYYSCQSIWAVTLFGNRK